MEGSNAWWPLKNSKLSAGKHLAWWPMEGFKLDGFWKEKDKHLFHLFSLSSQQILFKPFCCDLNFGFATNAKGLVRVRAKTKSRSRILMPLGVQKSVRERTLTLPSELPCWELKSQWTPKCLESDCKG
jgi:hypothetical protein